MSDVVARISASSSSRPRNPQSTPAVSTPAQPEDGSASFTDSVGRTVEVPAEITSVAVSGPLAQMVIFALCPDKLVGIADEWDASAEQYLATEYYNLPLLGQLRQTGLTCILVEMPFHLAIFDVNAAEDVMAQFPDIRHWYIAGHSMGGAMASQFASEHPDEVDGLILLGAYLYGDYPPDTLTVYGSLNQSVEDKIDYTENVVEIEGGNHAQFGNYGPQKGDAPATISAEEQQAQALAAISDFIARQQE